MRFVNESNKLYCYIDKKLLNTNKQAFKAALDTIDKIVKNNPGPYTLLCSGGVDSQAMAYAWKKSCIPHEIILFQYINNEGEVFNDYDLKTFFVFADKHDIDYSVKNFNYFKFLENDLITYAKKYDCASPQLTAMIKMIESIGKGTILLSGNFFSFVYNLSIFTYDILGLQRFADSVINYKVIPFFFLYTSDLAFGFLDEVLEKNIRNSYTGKCEIYKLNGFPVISQDTKISGFEKIKDFFDTQKHIITPKDRLKFLNEPSKRVFDIKFRYLLREQLKKEPEFKIILT